MTAKPDIAQANWRLEGNTIVVDIPMTWKRRTELSRNAIDLAIRCGDSETAYAAAETMVEMLAVHFHLRAFCPGQTQLMYRT